MAFQTRTGIPPVARFSADRRERHRSLAESVRNRDFGEAVLGEKVVDRLGDEALHRRPAFEGQQLQLGADGLWEVRVDGDLPDPARLAVGLRPPVAGRGLGAIVHCFDCSLVVRFGEVFDGAQITSPQPSADAEQAAMSAASPDLAHARSASANRVPPASLAASPTQLATYGQCWLPISLGAWRAQRSNAAA